MLLPTQPTAPREEFADYSTLLYGVPKIGKSTLASEFPDPVMLATEAGYKALRCHVVPLTDYESFLHVCAEIAAGKHGFRSVIVDTCENLFALCQRYVCERLRVEHESDRPCHHARAGSCWAWST
jgi:hypothetical protein